MKIRLLVYPDPGVGAKTEPEPTEDRLGRIGGQRRGRNFKEEPQLKNILAPAGLFSYRLFADFSSFSGHMPTQ